MTILLPGSAQGPGAVIRNSSTAQQAFTAATRAVVAGTLIKVPVGGLKAGARYRARFNIAKTAAGTATSTVDVAVGTTATGLNTARLSFTKPAGTAVADEGVIEVDVLIRSVSATGVIAGEMTMGHNLSATGHAQIPFVAVSAVSAAFDNSGDGLYIAVCLTTGASDVITTEVAGATLEIQNGG
jgi:hypothetical protein